MAKKIIARLILEILGAPKTHVEETLKLIVNKLAEEKEAKVLKKEIYEAQEQENTLWSAFAEVEIELKDIRQIAGICFDYMPSSIEILEPAGMETDFAEFSDMFNDLLAKLHKYDMLVKNFNAENILLKEKMEKMRQENFAMIKKMQGK